MLDENSNIYSCIFIVLVFKFSKFVDYNFDKFVKKEK